MGLDEPQQRILQAAGQIFAEKGYQATTIREICERAEVNVAAVNYYFGSKEELYSAVLKHAFGCRLDQLPLPQWTSGTPVAIKLRDFIHLMVDRMVQIHLLPWQTQLLLRALLGQPSPASTELVREFIRPLYEFLWGLIRDALPRDISEEKLHLVAFSIVGQAFYLNVARPVVIQVVGEEEFGRYDSAKLAGHITEFTLAALGLDAPVARREKMP